MREVENVAKRYAHVCFRGANLSSGVERAGVELGRVFWAFILVMRFLLQVLDSLRDIVGVVRGESDDVEGGVCFNPILSMYVVCCALPR